MPGWQLSVIMNGMFCADEEPKPLYWEASYEIVLSLMETHPDADLDALGLQQLFEWIIALPGFADDPILAHDALLTEILREWYEEKTETS
jgi:FeS assembly protein IscX